MIKVANFWFKQGITLLSSAFPDMTVTQYSLSDFRSKENVAREVLACDLVIVGFVIENNPDAGDSLVQDLNERNFVGRIIRFSMGKRVSKIDQFGNPLIDMILSDGEVEQKRIAAVVKTVLNLS